jgi:dTDP-4-dehydrorhamnose reductase
MGTLFSRKEPANDELLIVGADGLLGGALRRHCRQAGKPVVATSLLDIPDKDGLIFLDLSQPPESWPPLPSCSAAILCAAITSLEQCRRDPAGTRLVNVLNTLELARRLSARGCFVVFISSNLVFDGSRPNRKPDEPLCPQNEYGSQKAEAEKGLSELGCPAAIVRLTKVFHPGLPVIQKWIGLLDKSQPVHPFTDMICSPIALDATINAIAQVAGRRKNGIWHLSGSKDISYANIARQIARLRNCQPDLVQPASAKEAGYPESLPAHSTLDASKAQQELGFEILRPEAVIAQTLSP